VSRKRVSRQINDCSGAISQSPFRSEFLGRPPLDLPTHYLCQLCDKLHQYSALFATETVRNRLITPLRTEDAKKEADSPSTCTSDSDLFHKQLIVIQKNEDKNASIYHCTRTLRNSYIHLASTVGLVFGPTHEYDIFTHTMPFALVEHLDKCRRLSKKPHASEVFPASSSIYHGHGENEIWAEDHARATTRLELDSTENWGSGGLFIACTLRFTPVQATRQLHYNIVTPSGYGLVICPHIATTRSGTLTITDKEYTRLYSDHGICTPLREDLFTACGFTDSKQPSKVDDDDLYESETRGCQTCPTEFQTRVNYQGDVVVTIWRFLENNVEDALRSNMGIPFNNLNEFARKRKTKFVVGEVKQSLNQSQEYRTQSGDRTREGLQISHTKSSCRT
jgi:hypothetical protein